MSMKCTINDSISLETLDYSIEDGNLKINNKEFTEILKKEKIHYIHDFKVSINPKKDVVFVKKGSNEIYLQIINKLLNINASMQSFKKNMKNKNISPQKTLPSFNPEKLSNYYQRNSEREIIDFPEPLEADKFFNQIQNKANLDKLPNSLSEEFSFSDDSNDISNNFDSSNAFKKSKSSPFGLSIYMTPNEHSEKTTPIHSSLTPQISLATCFDDNSSSSSANSSSFPTSSSNNNNNSTTLFINQPQIYDVADNNINNVSSPAPFQYTQNTSTYQHQMQIQIQPPNLYSKANTPLATFKPSIKPPEHTKLNIQFKKKKETSSTYKITGDEAKILKFRSALSDLLHIPPNVEIQKILFVS